MNTEQWTNTIINATASFWNKIASFLPNLVATLVIFIIGWLVARVVAKWSVKLLNKLGFDALCERIGLSEAMHKAGITKSPADIFGKFKKSITKHLFNF